VSSSANKTYLGDYVDFQNGYAFKSSDYTAEGSYLVRIKNVQQGFIEINDECFVKVPNETKFEKFKLKNGDIVVSLTGNVGRIARIKDDHLPAVLNQRVASIAPKDKKIVGEEYLYYLLRTPEFFDFAIGLGKGAAQQNISTADMEKFEVRIPSPEKQREIVEKLDSVFAEIDSLEDNLELSIQKLDQLLHSMLNAEFALSEPGLNLSKPSTVESISKDVVRIGDVCKLMTGGTPSRARPEYFENGTIRWLVSGDINKVEIFDCDGRITPEAMKSSNAKILPMNSVMIALNGQGKTRGTVALLRTEATCNQSLVSISPMNENQLLPEFLFHNLRMRYQEIRRMTGDDGNDRRGLNMILIRDIEIPLPSLQKQRKTVEKLDLAFTEIETMRNQIAVKQDFARMLRQSLLREAFSSKNEMV
jgi:type I restriction enzyme S subunit